MKRDAKFEDGYDEPLNLGAISDDDVQVISSLVQDSVFGFDDMKWHAKERRFVMLLNRFRWEVGDDARRGTERVRSILIIKNVVKVASMGIDRNEAGIIFSLMTIEHENGNDGQNVLLTLSGDGAIRLQVSDLEVMLRDVTRPYRAPSGKVPDHGLRNGDK